MNIQSAWLTSVTHIIPDHTALIVPGHLLSYHLTLSCIPSRYWLHTECYCPVWSSDMVYQNNTNPLQLKLCGLSPQANYTDLHLSAKLIPTFADRGCHVVSVTSLQLYFQISRPEQLLFLSSSSSVVLTRLSRPCSTSTTTQKIW
jgi:hypothetical protein